MNTWRVRHQGSPEHTEGLTAQQVVEGVQEGIWDPTDEIRGDFDREWVSIETHPQFEEAMSEIEPPFSPPQPEHTSLDMNPMIDVALVLLIFFILTTTYEEMRKMFKAPDAEKEEVKDKQGAGTMPTAVIHVVATMENGQPVIRVEREVVAEKDLQAKIEFWKGKSGHNELAVELDKNVPWKTFMAIQDAAAGAKIERTLRIERVSNEEK